MVNKLCILVCENLLREAAAVVESEQLGDVAVHAVAASCGRPNVDWDGIEAAIRTKESEYDRVQLLCGACFPFGRSTTEGRELSRDQAVVQWPHLFASVEFTNSLLHNGAYLVSPGWLSRWRQHLDAMGFDRKTAHEYFGEFAKRLVLLDSGICADSMDLLGELADYLGLPSEIIPVGLDLFRLELSNLVLRWRLDRTATSSGAESALARRQTSEYAMALDLTAELASVTTEEQAVDDIFNLFIMLFAPKQMAYLSIGCPEPRVMRTSHTTPDLYAAIESRLAVMTSDYEWATSGRGFLLKIKHQEETVGAALIDELAFPEHKEHYLNLALGISRVCGLAIANARAFTTLKRAEEVAESATRTKSQFLANMSHELRTPMTGVLGLLDLVLLSNLEAEQRELIETAQTSAHSLVLILNDILDLTKIEMGKLSIVEKPFSIRKCVELTFNILQPVVKSKGIDLNFTVADEIPETLVGDQTRLNQILTNLAGNAVKFTNKGGVEINVAAGGSPSSGKREVTFTVTDTGIGIPEDKKDLLFRNFSQIDESHSREYGGTGLGLAISKEIVERMGGIITFTSEEGKGSSFFYTIPFGEVEPEYEAIFASVGTAAAEDAPRAEGMKKPRILVAEDDHVIRQVLGTMLQLSNYEIDFAENGQKAVEMWESGLYDLILMDVQMPRMNGFEAAAAIREKECTRGGHIPIVAMTAHALKKDEERCLGAGMDSYISKPIDFKKTLQVIGDIIKQKSREGLRVRS